MQVTCACVFLTVGLLWFGFSFLLVPILYRTTITKVLLALTYEARLVGHYRLLSRCKSTTQKQTLCCQMEGLRQCYSRCGTLVTSLMWRSLSPFAGMQYNCCSAACWRAQQLTLQSPKHASDPDKLQARASVLQATNLTFDWSAQGEHATRLVHARRTKGASSSQLTAADLQVDGQQRAPVPGKFWDRLRGIVRASSKGASKSRRQKTKPVYAHIRVTRHASNERDLWKTCKLIQVAKRLMCVCTK